MLDPILVEPAAHIGVSEAAALVREHFGLAGVIHPLAGERDANFCLRLHHGERVVVKFAHPLEPYDVSDLQSRALLHLERTAPDLPLPRMRWPLAGVAPQVTVTPGAGPPRQLRVYSYLSGTPAVGPVETSFQWRLGKLAAHIDRALGDFAHAADGRSIDWDLRRLPEACEPVERTPEIAHVVDAYDRIGRAALAALPDQVVHNDLNPHNVLVDNPARSRITGILDFGDLVRAPRAIELATAAAYQIHDRTRGWQDVTAMARGYHAAYPLSRDELRLVPVLIAMRAALSVAINRDAVRAGRDNSDYLMRNVTRAASALETLARLDLERAGDEFAEAVIAR